MTAAMTELPDYDISLDSDLSTGQLARVLTNTIFTKGYCIIQMSTSGPEAAREGIMAAAKGRTDWTLPKQEVEAAYLGYGSRSKVVWLDGQPKVTGDNLLPDPLMYYRQCLGLVHTLLVRAVKVALDFKPGSHLGGALLRMPLTTADADLVQDGLNEEDVEKGHVEKHLDFVQRRRLGMIYVIETLGGQLELHPRSDLNEEAMSIPILKDKLIVFRHDMMTYSYLPKSPEDLVLQAWLMEEPQQLSLGNLEGDQASMQNIFGGPPQSVQEQIHITGAATRLPGNSSCLDDYAAMVITQTDAQRTIPFFRWDMDVYYTEDSGQFATAGKSVQKHAALLQDRVLAQFDNTFWGIESQVAECIAPIQRVTLEVSYEILVMSGHNRKSLKGAPAHVYIGDIGVEWQCFENGYRETPEAYITARSTGFGIPTASRLCYHLGITGPTMSCDTACSASMVAVCMMRAAIEKYSGDPRGAEGITTGQQNILSPFPFIGLSGAGMIGRSGRTRTFDVSANGYARGEGCAGMFIRKSQDIEVAQNRLGCFVSCYINQDGRSASLTAPNGPSQQACLRGSLARAGLEPDDFAGCENHGTGTALGDPIETGSVCRVFRTHLLLPITSTKTLIGHLECAAGVSVFCKVLLTLMHSVVSPNNHLRELNPHMAADDASVVYPNSIMDIPAQSKLVGMNAFGFGGTNSRGEIWTGGRRWRNPREVVRRGINGLQVDKLGPAALLPRELSRLDAITVPCPKCMGEACWLCGMALPPENRRGKHHCSAIREEYASYEYCSNCYDGAYQWGPSAAEAPLENGGEGHCRQIYMVGTFNAWAGFEEMTEVRGGVYTGRLILGDTRLERFHLVEDRDSSRAIFPVVSSATSAVQVAGPRADALRRSWAIDGRGSRAPAGSEYEVTFTWEDTRKSISWAPSGGQLPMEGVRAAYPHAYSVARLSTGWRLEDMSSSVLGPGYREWQGKIGGMDGEQFHLVRDRDPAQTIYPLHPCPSDESVPVMGPDEGGAGKGWLAQGGPGDTLVVSLEIRDGDLAVMMAVKQKSSLEIRDGDLSVMMALKQKSSRPMVWRSAKGGARNFYYVVGSWSCFHHNDSMEPDAEDPHIYRCQFSIGRTCSEEFHIAVNASSGMQLHPACERGAPGEAMLCGPGENQESLNWQVQGPCGTVMEAVLNLAAEDHCAMLTCYPIFVPPQALEPPDEREGLEDLPEEPEEPEGPS